jgi:hypothetical protein
MKASLGKNVLKRISEGTLKYGPRRKRIFKSVKKNEQVKRQG